MIPIPFAPRTPLPAFRLLALGAALLWGMVELVALWRSRWPGRAR